MAGKADLINSIVDSVDIGLTPQAGHGGAFEAVFAAITSSVKAGESTPRSPASVASPSPERASRKGRNPATGESITIKAKQEHVRFKPGRELKEAVNKKRRK